MRTVTSPRASPAARRTQRRIAAAGGTPGSFAASCTATRRRAALALFIRGRAPVERAACRERGLTELELMRAPCSLVAPLAVPFFLARISGNDALHERMTDHVLRREVNERDAFDVFQHAAHVLE